MERESPEEAVSVFILCDSLLQDVLPRAVVILECVLNSIVLVDCCANEVPEDNSGWFLCEGCRVKKACGDSPGEHEDGDHSPEGRVSENFLNCLPTVWVMCCQLLSMFVFIQLEQMRKYTH